MTWRACVGHPAYEVSAAGEVRRVAPWGRSASGFQPLLPYLLVPTTGPRGYAYVKLDGQKVCVHRLVACAFLLPVGGKTDVAHNDGDRANNRVSNLRWATRRENQHDRWAHGTSNRGERHGMHKLREGDVKQIRASNAPAKAVAAAFGVSAGTINDIRSKRSWAHV